LTGGGFVTDAGQVEIAHGIQRGGFELQALVASAEHGEKIGLA
jgi:hypothetical protein